MAGRRRTLARESTGVSPHVPSPHRPGSGETVAGNFITDPWAGPHPEAVRAGGDGQ